MSWTVTQEVYQSFTWNMLHKFSCEKSEGQFLVGIRLWPCLKILSHQTEWTRDVLLAAKHTNSNMHQYKVSSASRKYTGTLYCLLVPDRFEQQIIRHNSMKTFIRKWFIKYKKWKDQKGSKSWNTRFRHWNSPSMVIQLNYRSTKVYQLVSS